MRERSENMIVLLFALYILQANGAIVPDWCLLVAWVMTCIRFTAGIIKAMLD